MLRLLRLQVLWVLAMLHCGCTRWPVASGEVFSEQELADSIDELQAVLVGLDKNSDSYRDTKAEMEEKRIFMKNLKWLRVGLPESDYDELCELDIELTELRNMPPAAIIELTEEDKEQRLVEIRSLKKSIKGLTADYKDAMKNYAASQRPVVKTPVFTKDDGQRLTGHRGERFDDGAAAGMHFHHPGLPDSERNQKKKQKRKPGQVDMRNGDPDEEYDGPASALASSERSKLAQGNSNSIRGNVQDTGDE